MSGRRPYNEYLGADLIDWMVDNGPVVTKATDGPELTVVSPDFEHYPTRVEEATVSILGIARVLTQEGRRERAEERSARLAKRENVLAYAGERITNPAKTDDPAEKTGWVGTRKFDESPVTWRRQSLRNLGYQLLDIKASSGQEPSREPNLLRPATFSERWQNKRLEHLHERINELRGRANWLEGPYGKYMEPGAYPLSRKEAGNMGAISRDIAAKNKKAARLERKFDAIASSNDWRSRVHRWRQGRAERRADKTPLHPGRRVGQYVMYTLPNIIGPNNPPLFVSDHYQHYLQTLEDEGSHNIENTPTDENITNIVRLVPSPDPSEEDETTSESNNLSRDQESTTDQRDARSRERAPRTQSATHRGYRGGQKQRARTKRAQARHTTTEQDQASKGNVDYRLLLTQDNYDNLVERVNKEYKARTKNSIRRGEKYRSLLHLNILQSEFQNFFGVSDLHSIPQPIWDEFANGIELTQKEQEGLRPSNSPEK